MSSHPSFGLPCRGPREHRRLLRIPTDRTAARYSSACGSRTQDRRLDADGNGRRPTIRRQHRRRISVQVAGQVEPVAVRDSLVQRHRRPGERPALAIDREALTECRAHVGAYRAAALALVPGDPGRPPSIRARLDQPVALRGGEERDRRDLYGAFAGGGGVLISSASLAGRAPARFRAIDADRGFITVRDLTLDRVEKHLPIPHSTGHRPRHQGISMP